MLMQSGTITVEKTSHTPGIFFCPRFMTVADCYTVERRAKSKQRRRHVSLRLTSANAAKELALFIPLKGRR
jgi:hypothetical protein